MVRMIHDLALATGVQEVCVDICIIGSGPAGLTLARSLSELGSSIVVVESGPMTPRAPADGEIPVFARREYKGATVGRRFGLGGTSVLWGGQLLPIRAEEMQARANGSAPGWPVTYEDLARHFNSIESWAGVSGGSFVASREELHDHPISDLTWKGLVPRFSKWIPFRRRNLARTWLPVLEQSNRVQIWINAVATCWEFDGDATLELKRLIALSPRGNRLQVDAAQFVICAGAIESSRLALEVARLGADARRPIMGTLGRSLHDHVSLRVGQIEPVDRKQTVELLAPMFAGSTMRSLRLDLTTEASIRDGMPPAYLHVVMETSGASGFASVRDLLRSLQSLDARAAIRASLRLTMALPEVLEILYWRFMRKRLMFTRGSKLYLNLDFEQPQLAQNCLRLGEAATLGGRARLIVDWDLPAYPRELIVDATQRIKTFWELNDLDRIARLRIMSAAEVLQSLPDNMYDIFHPAGTTRMSQGEQEGAVSPDLRLFGTANCYVLSTSVFPTMGSANPTFTLMALGLRLARHLARGPSKATGDRQP